MSRKTLLITVLFLLLITLACSISPPVTEQTPTVVEPTAAEQQPGTTEAVYPEPLPDGDEAYPAPPTADESGADDPASPTENEAYPAPPTANESGADNPASPTETDAPEESPTATASSTISPSATPTASTYSYTTQDGTPLFMPNFAHPEAGCNWMGVAGHVFDGDGNTIENLVVIAGGTLDGASVDLIVFTGSAPAYGAGGYEFVLSNALVASEGTVWVQVKDLSDKVLTPKIYLDTHASCAENLILLNFVPRGE